MAGLWYEEFTLGQTFAHPIRRTITEADNVGFSCTTMNPQPLHIDADFASRTSFGQPLVNSLFTLAVMIGISVYETTLGTTVANLGMTDVNFPIPVFHGDTLSVRTEVLATRDSKSKPAVGIVTFLHTAFNQHGVAVAFCTRNAMMHRRAAMASTAS